MATQNLLFPSLAQAVVGRDPEPLILATGTGDMLLTLTPRLWPVPLH